MCVLAAACGGSGPSAPPTIADVPSLTIRVPDSLGGGSGEMGRALRLADNGVAVADWERRRVLRFDSLGTLQRVYGRDGSGPGAFRAPNLIQVVTGDSLLLWDPVLRRVSWLSLETGETRDLLLQSSLVYGSSPIVGQMNDGTLLVKHELQDGFERPPAPVAGGFGGTTPSMGIGVEPASPFPSSGKNSVRAVVFRMDGGGRQVAQLADDVLVRELEGTGFRFFTPALQMGTNGDRVVMGYNASWQVRVLDASGDSVTTLTRDWRARAVTDAERETLVASLVRANPSAVSPASIRFADSVPAFGRLLMSGDGTVWVNGFTVPAQFTDSVTVFNARGRLLGTLALPPRLIPTDVGRDYLLGVGVGDDGVFEIRRYDVRW